MCFTNEHERILYLVNTNSSYVWLQMNDKTIYNKFRINGDNMELSFCYNDTNTL